MGNLIEWISDRLGVSTTITIALFVAALFIPAAAVIIGGRDLEVDYSISPIVSLCGKVMGKKISGMTPDNCMTLHELKLANTGAQDQPHITVRFPVANVAVNGIRTYELVASSPTPPEPIKFEATDIPGEYTINQLHPNTLVTVKLQTSGLGDARALAHGDTKVQASGRVLNVDPHAATLIRFFYAMMGVLGL
jgi:hypothetical protein